MFLMVWGLFASLARVSRHVPGVGHKNTPTTLQIRASGIKRIFEIT
jgi:hypothetical protein